MNSRWPTISLLVLSGGYVIGFLFNIILRIIAGNEHISLDHSFEQGMILLFIFSVGILFSMVYLTIMFPDIRSTVHKTALSSNPSPFDVLLHVSTEEEADLIRNIKELAPRAYKFELARKTGLSRMKVHRILLRLAERGIVNVEKEGRYAQVSLAEWLSK